MLYREGGLAEFRILKKNDIALAREFDDGRVELDMKLYGSDGWVRVGFDNVQDADRHMRSVFVGNASGE